MFIKKNQKLQYVHLCFCNYCFVTVLIDCRDEDDFCVHSSLKTLININNNTVLSMSGPDNS